MKITIDTKDRNEIEKAIKILKMLLESDNSTDFNSDSESSSAFNSLFSEPEKKEEAKEDVKIVPY